MNKHQNVPIWVLANYLDFGDLRHMLISSTTKIQNAVAKDMMSFIYQHIPEAKIFPPETMLSFVENINDIRNICAHNNRLIGFNCRRDIDILPMPKGREFLDTNDTCLLK